LTRHDFFDGGKISDVYNPIPFEEHPRGITFVLPLGKLVKQSRLKNGVTIYDDKSKHTFSTYLSLIPFGMTVEKHLMEYFKYHFTEFSCKFIDDNISFDKICGSTATEVDGFPEIVF
jgi:hypothetical protein